MKQSFLFLPNSNPKRPIIVPQENLILKDDSLLQEDTPQCISDPLPPIQPIASQPLGDCEKSCYHAIAKNGYSHNELLFILEPLKKSTNEIPQPESFPPTEKIQNYIQLMEILKPYLNHKKDILITIADIVSTLEQTRDPMQNLAFDTTRVS